VLAGVVAAVEEDVEVEEDAEAEEDVAEAEVKKDNAAPTLGAALIPEKNRRKVEFLFG